MRFHKLENFPCCLSFVNALSRRYPQFSGLPEQKSSLFPSLLAYVILPESFSSMFTSLGPIRVDLAQPVSRSQRQLFPEAC